MVLARLVLTAASTIVRGRPPLASAISCVAPERRKECPRRGVSQSPLKPASTLARCPSISSIGSQSPPQTSAGGRRPTASRRRTPGLVLPRDPAAASFRIVARGPSSLRSPPTFGLRLGCVPSGPGPGLPHSGVPDHPPRRVRHFSRRGARSNSAVLRVPRPAAPPRPLFLPPPAPGPLDAVEEGGVAAVGVETRPLPNVRLHCGPGLRHRSHGVSGGLGGWVPHNQ